MEIADLFDPTSRIRQKLAFGPSMRRRTYSKIQQFVRNGKPLSDSIQVLIEQQSERKNRQSLVALLQRWHHGILNGQAFSDVIHDDVPSADRTLLHAGEKSGHIDSAIGNILFLHEATKRMKGLIKGGVSYPLVFFSLALALMAFVTFTMVPTYAELSPPETWTGAAKSLHTGAQLTIHVMPFVVAIVIGLLALSIWSLPIWTGDNRKFMEKVPPYSIYKVYHGTSFLVALAALIGEGVKGDEALKIIMQNGSPWFNERIEAALFRMENGEKIANALFNTGFEFPDREIVDDIRAFQDSENFDQLLQDLAKEALETALQKIAGQMLILKNMGMVAFGGVLLWFIFGMFGMNQMISNLANSG
jgi:type II secretory pathway component PulF